MWDRLPARLADDVTLQVVAFPRGARSLQEAAESLLPKLETASRPRVLLGHDLGGAVALEMCQLAAMSVDGLVLHAPAGARRRHRIFTLFDRRPPVPPGWRAALRPVADLPAALLWGEKDRVLPVREVEAFRPLFPRAFVSLPGRWGHTPMRDDPSGYAREICALVRKLVGDRFPRSPPSAC